MTDPIGKFYEFLGRPLYPKGRLVLALLVIPLALSFAFPLWRISMEAPQYPQGLYLDIYSYMISGGNEGQHLQEINNLNHYIGMAPINRAALSDLDWIPFLFGALVLLTLRVAAIGNVSALVDLVVLSGYASTFAMVRFVYRLYTFGHNLSPEAPVKVPPFTPVIVGTKQIANFTTHSYPQLGTYLVGVFLLGLCAVLLWHLVSGRRAAVRAERPAQPEGPRGRAERPAPA